MSLSAAITAIIEGMEEDAEHEDGDRVSLLIMSHVKQLRIALKAAGPEPQQHYTPVVNHQDLINKAREEFRTKRITEPAEEKTGTRFALMVGGSEDGVTAPIPVEMPTGAYVALGGQKYQLREDGKLHACIVDESER